MSPGARPAWLALLVVVSLCLAATGTGAAAPTTDGGQAPASQAGGQAVTADLNETVNTTLRADLRSNGDARWTITATFNLSSDAEKEVFRQRADAFESGETESIGLDAFRQALATVEPTVEREMEIKVVQQTADRSAVDNGTGTLSVSFTWTNFARTDGDRLMLDDVYNGTSGPWLSGLDADQRLEIHPPSGYGVIDAEVAPEERGSLIWQGPVTFQQGDLHATFAGSAGPPDDDDGGDPTDDDSLADLAPLIGGLVLLLVLAALAYAFRDRLRVLIEPGAGAADEEEGDDEGTAEDTAAASGGAAAGEAAADETDDEPDPELLSDEERVQRLLEENGGRMKQARIVKETGWSNAKVSQLLSGMAEEDEIDKLRIGRENLISFPDEDVTEIEED